MQLTSPPGSETLRGLAGLGPRPLRGALTRALLKPAAGDGLRRERRGPARGAAGRDRGPERLLESIGRVIERTRDEQLRRRPGRPGQLERALEALAHRVDCEGILREACKVQGSDVRASGHEGLGRLLIGAAQDQPIVEHEPGRPLDPPRCPKLLEAEALTTPDATDGEHVPGREGRALGEPDVYLEAG